MNKVKITVLKTTLDTELAKEYGVDGLRPVIFKLEATKTTGTIDYAPMNQNCKI